MNSIYTNKINYQTSSKNKTNDLESYFISTLKIQNSKILAPVGILENEWNEENVFNFAMKLKHFLLLHKQKIKLMLYCNKSEITTVFGSIISSVLSEETKIEVFLYDKDTNFSLQQYKSEFIQFDFDFFISLDVFQYKKKDYVELQIKQEELKPLDSEQISYLNSLENEVFQEKWSIEKLKNNNQAKILNPIEIKQNIEKNANFLLSLQENFKFKFGIFNNLNDDSKVAIDYFKKNNIDNIKSLSWSSKNNNLFNKFNKKIIWKKLTKRVEKNTDFIFWIKDKNIDILYKNKRFFEYLSTNELQLICLEYLRKFFINNREVKFIVNLESLDYVKTFLKEHFQEQIVFYSNQNQEEYLIQKYSKQQVFLFNQQNFFFFNNKENTDYSLTSQALFYIRVLEALKEENDCFLKQIDNLKTKYNFQPIYQFKQRLNYDNFRNFIHKLNEEKVLVDLTIKSVKFLEAISSENEEKIKIVLDKNTIIYFLYNKIKRTLKTTIISDLTKQNYKDAIINENEIKKEIKTLSKHELQKQQNKKNALKAFVLASVIVVILFFLFYQVYKITNQDVGQSFSSLLNGFYDVFLTNLKKRVFILFIVIYYIFFSLGNGFLMYRIMKKLHIPIKFRHISMSLFLGVFMANSTPFYFGGEIIQYWYLQKKGYKLRKILSAFTYAAFLHQIFILIYSLIMLPLGFYFYKDNLLVFDSVDKIILFVWLIFNIFINLFVTLIILVLSIWTKLQHKAILVFIWLLSFNPVQIIEDKSRLNYFLQAEAELFRKNFYFVIKDFKFFLETLFYKAIVFSLINMNFFILLRTTQTAIEKSLHPELYNNVFDFVGYIKFLSGTNILIMSNNLNPTPSGLGSIDLISLMVFKNYFPVANSDPTIAQEGDYYLKVFNFSGRVLTWLIPYISSGVFLIIVWIGEKRLEKYRTIRHAISLNPEIKNKVKRTYSIYFKVTYSIVAVVVISLLLTILFF
ncbi:lysylphosphatidylglycerol synthase transmembrane domain-containing protein [Mycoplasma sp. 1654_15]|uniref:lysylphosphatidylglycerol synthase transmembrane domain-containing protein n=1 Tax=Mycoplasma sp. 1654_15 TaxID=2725994 RepID=UPI001448EA63|nr:lysylphosphatidylglycerol synthase transmembrane domain-containing protein [Mycoplasma sp. 1654_15]QJB71184.1 flippase-like domain-containing protein [Mycoplasma sp. 1654_15]